MHRLWARCGWVVHQISRKMRIGESELCVGWDSACDLVLPGHALHLALVPVGVEEEAHGAGQVRGGVAGPGD